MNVDISSAAAESGSSVGFKVDLSRGDRVSRVSSEWFSRPNDERYLSLPELYAAVRARADRAATRTVESHAIRVEARRDDTERLSLIVPGQETLVAGSRRATPLSLFRYPPGHPPGSDLSTTFVWDADAGLSALQSLMGRLRWGGRRWRE